MAVLSTPVVLAAATPAVLAQGDASGVYVSVLTALTDLLLGGSAAQQFPVAANTVFSTVLQAGDTLYGVSATGGTVNVLRTRS
jgi:hypothetical protein